LELSLSHQGNCL